MPETQPRIGHLRTESTNDTDRTGRELVTETQPRVGHLRTESANDTDRKGSTPEPLEVRGYIGAEEGEHPTPRRIDDKVRTAKGGGY